MTSSLLFFEKSLREKRLPRENVPQFDWNAASSTHYVGCRPFEKNGEAHTRHLSISLIGPEKRAAGDLVEKAEKPQHEENRNRNPQQPQDQSASHVCSPCIPLLHSLAIQTPEPGKGFTAEAIGTILAMNRLWSLRIEQPGAIP
jgi:hypothetical protein